jgi:hypothetical protein
LNWSALLAQWQVAINCVATGHETKGTDD